MMSPGMAATAAPGLSDPQAAEAALVRRFWSLYQARRWSEAQALLHPDAECYWWATAERFQGAAAIVHVNAVYPEGWSLCLLEVNPLGSGRVHTLLRVDHGEQAFYANSFFQITAGLIQRLDEYWSDLAAAPAWRQTGQLPGLTKLAPDQRSGLSLDLGSS